MDVNVMCTQLSGGNFVKPSPLVSKTECASMLEQEALDLPRLLINTLPHDCSSHSGRVAAIVTSIPYMVPPLASSSPPSPQSEQWEVARAHSVGRALTRGVNLYSDGAYMRNVAPSERKRVLLKKNQE